MNCHLSEITELKYASLIKIIIQLSCVCVCVVMLCVDLGFLM